MLEKTRVGGLVAFALVAVAAACSSSSSSSGGGDGTTPIPPGTTPAQATVGASGGRVATPDGALTVTVPPGAVPADTTITIEEIPSPAAGAIGKAYEIGPTGTQFAVPVTLSFAYGALDLQGNDPTSLEVATIANGAWVALAGDAVDTAAQVATGQTTHLSPYGIHVKQKGGGDDGGGDDGGGDATVSDGASSSDGSTADSGDAASDSGPTDSGFDANGCTPMILQVGTCANHPIQVCNANYSFMNCVDLAQGISYDCCPNG